MHLHFIPRYQTPFATRDGDFVDESCGTHYVLQGNFGRSLQDRRQWADALKEAFDAAIR